MPFEKATTTEKFQQHSGYIIIAQRTKACELYHQSTGVDQKREKVNTSMCFQHSSGTKIVQYLGQA